MLKVIRYGNNKLRELSMEINDFNDDLKKLADDMYETMIETNGIGLAAPQIGENIRLIIIDTKEDEEKESSGRINLINPKIISYSVKKVMMEEGCLSVPGVFAEIERPAIVKIEAQDLDGHKFEIKARGLLARVIQHEIDHLDGILFIDRLSDELFESIKPDLEMIKKGKIPNHSEENKKSNTKRVEI